MTTYQRQKSDKSKSAKLYQQPEASWLEWSNVCPDARRRFASQQNEQNAYKR